MTRLYQIGALLILSLWSTAGNAQERFFPADTLGARPELTRIAEEWYTKHLQALKEPSLWEQSKSPAAHSYRFLWLRSFNRPIAVRFDVNADGTGILTVKIANGQGGYEPGRLVTNKRRKIPKWQTDWALDRIKDWGFWSEPSLEKTDTITLDGASWVFEGVRDGKYHIVDRTSPEYRSHPRWLGEMMLFDLAGLKLLYQEVY